MLGICGCFRSVSWPNELGLGDGIGSVAFFPQGSEKHEQSVFLMFEFGRSSRGLRLSKCTPCLRLTDLHGILISFVLWDRAEALRLLSPI